MKSLAWLKVPLGTVLEKIIGGGTPSKSRHDYWGGDIPWASVKDFTSLVLKNTENHITESGLNESASNLIPEGVIVIPTRMALGKVAMTACPLAINQDLKALFPKDSIDRNYLFQWLLFKGSEICSLGSGSTVKGIRLETLKDITFEYPESISEQQKIAETLSTIDEKIDLIAQKITETKNLKTGLMQKLLSEGVGVQDKAGKWQAHTDFQDNNGRTIPTCWSITNLGSQLEKIIGGGTPSKSNPNYWNGDIPWASVKDFKTNALSASLIVDTITKEGVENSATNLIEPKTIVIPTRMALGKVAITEDKIAINQDLKALYPSSEIDNNFLFYWLQSQAKTIESLGSGSTVAGIRLEVLKALEFIYPTNTTEQKEIAKILSTVDKKIDLLEQQKTETQQLKKGLMQKLLTGEWRVPLDDSEAA